MSVISKFCKGTPNFFYLFTEFFWYSNCNDTCMQLVLSRIRYQPVYNNLLNTLTHKTYCTSVVIHSVFYCQCVASIWADTDAPSCMTDTDAHARTHALVRVNLKKNHTHTHAKACTIGHRGTQTHAVLFGINYNIDILVWR